MLYTQVKKIKMPWNKAQILKGTREEILAELKKLAKASCKKCYGRGWTFFKEDKKGGRTYIPCGKCIDKD